MKKVNFNTLQTLPTPDSWIESALSISSREEKPAAVLRHPRRMIAAASLVLVSMLSTAVWLAIGRNPAPIATVPIATESPTAGESAAPIDASTNTPTNALADTNTDATSDVSAAASTESPSVSAQPATQSASTTPQPTETAPTEAATSVPQSVSTDPPAPTEKPQSTSTEPPMPTEKPADPTRPPSPPTELPWFYEDEVIADVPGAKFPENGRIYCAIYDSDGSLFGDPDPYSDQHLATVLRYEKRRDSYLVVYRPSEKGVLPRPGYYTYRFYDEYGNVYRSDTRPLR